MAKILSFRTPELRAGEGVSRDASDTATIILFPGVRYERWSEDAASAATRSPYDERRASRDVLELAE